MQLKDYIKVYSNAIPGTTCNSLVKLAEETGFDLYDTPTYKFWQVNFNDKNLVNVAQGFAKAMIPLAKDYFKETKVSEYIDVQGFEGVRVKKYPKNEDFEFRPHIDAADAESAKRYLVFICYLNDNNGYTVFDQIGFKYKPTKGSVIVFPPFWMFVHSGVVPTDYDKYIMMTSLHFK